MLRKILVAAGVLCVAWPIACGLPVRVAAQGSPFASSDPLARALASSNVYVGKTLRSQVSESDLQTLTQNRPADRPVKIVVVNQLPASGKQYGSRGAYTKALHDYLNMGRGLLLVVTKNGPALAADGFSTQQIDSALQAHTSELQNDVVGGVRGILADYDAATANGTENTPSNGSPGSYGGVGAQAGGVGNGGDMEPQRGDGGGAGWLIPVGVLGAVGGIGALAWAGSRGAKNKQAMRQAMQPVERLRGEVVTGISYADNYLDLLPPSPDATAAMQARQSAAQLLEQAKGLAQSAKTAQDFGRAEAVLEQARQQAQVCRQAIDRATGGTGLAVSIDNTAYKTTPAFAAGNGLPAAQAAPIVTVDTSNIPENERGVCFFCSRPARISELTPVTITMNGQRRKVLACADDVRIIQQGATPEVRTVAVNGQRVPWYRSNSYDPYRDYTHTEVVFMPGFGVPYGGYGYGSGYFDGLMLGAMLSQSPMPYLMFVGPQGYPMNTPLAPGSGGYSDGGASGGYSDPGGYNSGYDHGNAGNNGGNPGDMAPTGGNDLSGFGQTDFFGASGSDFASPNSADGGNDSGFLNTGFGGDTNSGSDSGGFDFGGSSSSDTSSSSDFGSSSSSDSSSGFDSSGFDSGGSSDFGGGDSGGGGGDY